MLTLQNANSPSLWEWGLGSVENVMMSWVMVQVYPKLGQTAHPEVTVNKEPFGNELSAEGQPCLQLVTVHSWDLVNRNLSFERTLDLQQD